MDEKTSSKVVFISGDISDGSENDITMRQLIGENWKELTGAEQSREGPGSSPGYRHESYWKGLMERLTAIKEEEKEKEHVK